MKSEELGKGPFMSYLWYVHKLILLVNMPLASYIPGVLKVYQIVDYERAISLRCAPFIIIVAPLRQGVRYLFKTRLLPGLLRGSRRRLSVAHVCGAECFGVPSARAHSPRDAQEQILVALALTSLWRGS